MVWIAKVSKSDARKLAGWWNANVEFRFFARYNADHGFWDVIRETP
jgi:hypothetical protein